MVPIVAFQNYSITKLMHYINKEMFIGFIDTLFDNFMVILRQAVT